MFIHIYRFGRGFIKKNMVTRNCLEFHLEEEIDLNMFSLQVVSSSHHFGLHNKLLNDPRCWFHRTNETRLQENTVQNMFNFKLTEFHMFLFAWPYLFYHILSMTQSLFVNSFTPWHVPR